MIVVVVEFLQKCRGSGNKYSNIRSFIFFRLGEGFKASFKKDKNATFSGKEKYKEAFWDAYLFRIHEKTSNLALVVLFSSNIKISNNIL